MQDNTSGWKKELGMIEISKQLFHLTIDLNYQGSKLKACGALYLDFYLYIYSKYSIIQTP
jgi:hypothetical protein